MGNRGCRRGKVAWARENAEFSLVSVARACGNAALAGENVGFERGKTARAGVNRARNCGNAA
jgi:hypothetical protein